MYCCSGWLTECGTNAKVSKHLGSSCSQLQADPLPGRNTAQPSTALLSFAMRLAAIETAHSSTRLGKITIVSAERTSLP